MKALDSEFQPRDIERVTKAERGKSLTQHITDLTDWVVKQGSKTFTIHDAMKALRVPDSSYSTFARALSILKKKGVVVMHGYGRSSCYNLRGPRKGRIPKWAKEKKATVKMTPTVNGKVGTPTEVAVTI